MTQGEIDSMETTEEDLQPIETAIERLLRQIEKETDTAQLLNLSTEISRLCRLKCNLKEGNAYLDSI